MADREDGRICGKDISALYQQVNQSDAAQRNIGRIEWSRRMLNGEMQAPLPESITKDNPDLESIRVSVPQKYTGPLKLMNRLSEQWPILERYRSSDLPAASRAAQELEREAMAALELLYPHDVMVDLLLNEGEAVLLTYPELAGWDIGQIPDMYDEDGETPKKRYRVDKKGRDEDDDYYSEPGKTRKFTMDLPKTTENFKGMANQYFAEHVPVCMRPLSRLSYVPINPRRVGRYIKIDGLIECTEYRRVDLYRKRYRWGEDAVWSPTNQFNENSSDGTVKLYGMWGVDADGHVYVSYCVDGQSTWKESHDGEREEAVIDLTKDHGITDLSDVVTMEYGWSFPGASDPFDRGVPYPNVFGRSWLNIDALLTSFVYRHWAMGLGGKLYKPDAELIERLTENGKPAIVDIIPSKITPVLGDLVDTINVGPGPDAGMVISVLGAALDRTEVSSAEFTGSGGLSGYARNVAEADAFGTVTQIRRAILLVFEQAARNFMKQASYIGKKRRPVVLPINQPIVGPNGESAMRRSVVEVDPDLADGVFNFHAKYPINPEEHMALIQQIGNLVNEHRLPRRWIYEKGMGVTDPDALMDEADADALIDQPWWQLMQAQRALKSIGDEEKAAIAEALLKQELVKILPGEYMPAGADAGVPQNPMAMGGAPMPDMEGLGGQNFAEQSLAGVISGGMQAPSMAANQGVGTAPVVA